MLSRLVSRQGAALTRLAAASSSKSISGSSNSSSPAWVEIPQAQLSSLSASASSHPNLRYFSLSAPAFDNKTVNCPAFADSITEGDVMLIKEVGEFVKEDETVMEIETDKTSIPVPAPYDGTIVEILVEEGQTVNPGIPVYVIAAGEGSGTVAVKADPVEEKVEAPAAAAPAAAAPAPVASSLGAAPKVETKKVEQKAVINPLEDEVFSQAGLRSENRVKMTRMRQRISQRLKDSQNTAALLTTFNEIDMSEIMALRNRHKDAFLKKHGIKLGFMSAFAKASASALQDSPVINAVIDDATQEIVYRDYVDISVAVSTPKGLVVPVLRNVEGMNYFDIEREINNLAVKAREGNITVEDMDGGTFTISNGGVYGSLFGTPIVNPPQSAILGMHGTFQRPVAVNGKVEIRPMMYVALTYDHRLIDGKDAVTFLKKIKSGVEDPAVLLMNL